MVRWTQACVVWWNGATHAMNIICIARSNVCDYPTSPNIVPARRHGSHDWSSSNTKRHLHSSPNIAPAIPKYQENVLKTDETSFTMAEDSAMILAWPKHELVISHPPVPWSYFSALETHFVWKIRTFPARLSTQASPNPVRASKSDTATSANIAPTIKSSTPTSPMRLPRKVTLQHHQIAPAPQSQDWCVTQKIDTHTSSVL